MGHGVGRGQIPWRQGSDSRTHPTPGSGSRASPVPCAHAERTLAQNQSRDGSAIVCVTSACSGPRSAESSASQPWQRGAITAGSFTNCPPRAPAQPRSVRLPGCQTTAQLAQMTDPLPRIVVQPCPQAERSEMGGKVEQDQVYWPMLWSLESDSAARPATRLPSDTLVAFGIEHTEEQEDKAGVWAVQPPEVHRTPGPHLCVLAHSALRQDPGPSEAQLKGHPSLSCGLLEDVVCTSSQQVSETAMALVEGVSPGRAG